MIRIFFWLFILWIFLLSANPPSFADQSNSSNTSSEPQVTTAANAALQKLANAYYAKGMELINEGRLDEASDYFEKAIQIVQPPTSGYIQGNPEQLARQKELEAAYKKALDLYNQKRYRLAKEAFENVENIAPSYQASDNYLKIIDQDIILADAMAAKQQEAQKEKQNAMEAARIQEQTRLFVKAEEEQMAVNKKAEDTYNLAMGLYDQKDFAEAKKKFEEVSEISPNYKDTAKYLALIDSELGRQQQAALDQQRRAQEEAQRQQEAKREEQLEAQRLQIQAQARALYAQALALFERKDMDGALAKFNEVEKLYPDFKKTESYIDRIQQWQDDQQEKQMEAQKRVQEEAKRRKELAQERQRAQELKVKTDQASKIYDLALQSYRAHQWDLANAQFESIENLVPGFRQTERYLKKIGIYMAKEASAKAAHQTVSAPAAVSPNPPVEAVTIPQANGQSRPAGQNPPPPAAQAIVPVSNLQEQQKQAEEIADLSQKSYQLYRQIADIADDQITMQTKNKMAQVNDILDNLRTHDERQLQEQLKIRQEQMARIDRIYQEGVRLYGAHDYANARFKFQELENLYPDYKDTRHYLTFINEDLNKIVTQAANEHARMETERLRQWQNKAYTMQLQSVEQEEQKERQLAAQQQASLEDLTQKASAINDEIILLSQKQNYDAMKEKFVELENTINELTQLKEQMAKQKGDLEKAQELNRQIVLQHKELIREEQGNTFLGLKENPFKFNHLPAPAQELGIYKRREIMEEQNELFSEGVDRYMHRQYTQAKLLFGELADKHDRRAETWLKKVDLAISQELLKSQEAEERERTAFLVNQLKAQRELAAVQERERLRQKKLTEELERQMRLYEDSRLMQWRKEETMKAQELERQRQEKKRLQIEQAREQQEASFHFRKIENVTKPAVQAPPAPPKKDIVVEHAPVVAVDKQAELRAAAEKAAQAEKERREQFARQQQQEREEWANQQQIIREQSRNNKEFDRQERQQQAQLESQRASLHRQLEEGVESLYQEAMNLYREGNYVQAADRFKDVEDIFPGYKRTEQYMDEAHRKSLTETPRLPMAPASDNPTSMSRQDNISKALDLFDPNAK